MNNNNLAQHINYILGSTELPMIREYLQATTIPGVNFSHVDVNTGFGSKLHLQADSIAFNDISFTLLLSEDLSNYSELIENVFEHYNPENGTFAQRDFDIFIIPTNLKGSPLFRIDYHNCKIASIDDIDLTVNDDSEFNTFTINVTYDYYKLDFSHNNYKSAVNFLKTNNPNDEILKRII